MGPFTTCDLFLHVQYLYLHISVSDVHVVQVPDGCADVMHDL